MWAFVGNQKDYSEVYYFDMQDTVCFTQVLVHLICVGEGKEGEGMERGREGKGKGKGKGGEGEGGQA